MPAKTNDHRRVERARSKRNRLDPKTLSVNKRLDLKDVKCERETERKKEGGHTKHGTFKKCELQQEIRAVEAHLH